MDAIGRVERSTLTRPRLPVSRSALCVGAVALVLIFSGLGDTSLPSFDDAYHAQTAKEMLRRGDPITITYGGTPSFQSSPLVLWLTAPAYLAFGVGEYAARLPSAVLGLATIALVYFFARRRWGEEAGVAAAFILTATPLFLRYSRHAMMEVPLAFFVTAALLCLLAARRNGKWYFGFGLATGLAILTKSGLGLLPLIIAPIYLFLTGRARELIRPAFILSALLAMAVAGAWYLPALLMHGDTFVSSHFGDYLVRHALSGHHSELGLWGTIIYLVRIPLEYMPWTLLLIPALVWGVALWRKSEEIPGLWLAAVVPIAVLSLISSKYTRYLMPIFPPAALLIAATWVPRLPASWLRRLLAAIGWVSATAAVAIIVLPISLSEDRNGAMRALAPAAGKLTAQEEPVVNLGLDFYQHQNPLLFYGDRLFSQPLQRPEQLWDDLEAGEDRLALTSSSRFEGVRKAADASIDLKAVKRSGNLVLFQYRVISEEEWSAELKALVPFIRSLEAADRLGCYRLPRKRLKPILKKLSGRTLLRSFRKPRRLVRGMERSGTNMGIAWKRAFAELRARVRVMPELTRLAETDHLVLFRFEPEAGND